VKPASAGAPAASRNQSRSVSSHSSPRCQLMECLVRPRLAVSCAERGGPWIRAASPRR
jgi:hypothetical protein